MATSRPFSAVCRGVGVIKKRNGRAFVIMLACALCVCMAGALMGTTSLDTGLLLDANSRDFHIFWNLRVPQVLVAFLAGSGLACCGMTFQAMFLNTLATPFTLGVAGGASWGAASVIFLSGLSGVATGFTVSLGALVGASLAMGLVVLFSRTRMGHARHVMLLAGVAVSFFFSSLLLLTMALSDMYQSFQITRWLMGGIKVAGYREVLLLLPVVVPGLAILIWRYRELNLMLLGEEAAHTRGMDVVKSKRVFFLVVSVMVAVIVSVTGPIGFVGMVVPHICRILWGNDHRYLTPFSLLGGGCMLVACDLVARLVLPPAGIPVGVITSLIGAPFFFILLMRQGQGSRR